MVLAYMITCQRLVVILAAVAAWRAWRTMPGPGSRGTLTTFSVLVFALALLSSGVVSGPSH